MSKSPAILARRLELLTEKEKKISKTQLSELSGIDRGSLDNYMKGKTIPRLDQLDKIAAALNVSSSELIKNENEPLFLPHTLNDCFDSLAKGIAGAKNFDPDKISAALKAKALSGRDALDPLAEKLSDPLIREAVTILSTLDEGKRNLAISQLRSVARFVSQDSVGSKEKKIK